MTITVIEFSPADMPDLPETETTDSRSLAATSTETEVVKAGTVIVDPSTTANPFMLNTFNLVSLEGGVTNKLTVYVLVVTPSAAVTVTTRLLSPETKPENPFISTFASPF